MFVNFTFGISCYIYYVISAMSENRSPTGHELSDERTLKALGIGFAISTWIVTLSIYRKGGFDWVLQNRELRKLLVGIGWFCMAAITYASALFKWNWEWYKQAFLPFFGWLSKNNGHTWIPLLMLVPYFFLLNARLKANIPPQAYKIPLTIAFGSTILIGAGLLHGWLRFHQK